MKPINWDNVQGVAIALCAALFLTGCFADPVEEAAPSLKSRTGSAPAVCSVATTTTGTLSEAREIYADICAGYPQPDCDPALGGGWQCASVQIGDDAPPWVVATASPLPQASGVDDSTSDMGTDTGTTVSQPEPEEVETSSPSLWAATLGEAHVLFAAAYPDATYRDCDPSGSGWQCYTEVTGGAGPGSTSSSSGVDAAVIPASDLSVRFELENTSAAGWTVVDGYSEYMYVDSFHYPPTEAPLEVSFSVSATGTYRLRLRAKAAMQTAGRSDLHNDVWAKLDGVPASGTIDTTEYTKIFTSGDGNWHIGGTAKIESTGQTSLMDQVLTLGETYTLSFKGRSIGYAIDYAELIPINITGIPDLPVLGSEADYAYTFNEPYVAGDLLSVHWDSSWDVDDEQAMIMTREILDTRPDVDFIAVNGTKRRDHSSINAGSTAHMLSLFPQGIEAFSGSCDRGDTTTFCNDALQDVATYWQLTLQSGGRVHVADGGPSGFTSDVIRILVNRGVSLAETKRIRVFQHSIGWNEEHTDDVDLEFIRRYASYARIANGNLTQSAGLAAATPDYREEDATNSAQFRQLSLNSTYGSQWANAYSRYANRTDGSDSVEVMWALGIDRSVAPTLLTFANHYFN